MNARTTGRRINPVFSKDIRTSQTQEQDSRPRNSVGAPLVDGLARNLAELGDRCRTAQALDDGVGIHDPNSSMPAKRASSILATAICKVEPMTIDPESFDLSTLAGRALYAIVKSDNSPASIARSLGCKRQAVDQWIDGGTKNIKNALLFKFADLTRASARWLATGELPIHDLGCADEALSRLCRTMLSLNAEKRDLAIRLVDEVARPVQPSIAVQQDRNYPAETIKS